MKRREFMSWSGARRRGRCGAARQQPAMPVIGFLAVVAE